MHSPALGVHLSQYLGTGGTHAELSGCMEMCQAAAVCTQTTPTPTLSFKDRQDPIAQALEG